MGQELRRQANGWRPFVSLPFPRWPPVEDTLVEIDVAPPNRRPQRRAADARGARARVEPDKNEARDMPADMALAALGHRLCPTPSCQENLRGFPRRHPARPRLRFLGKVNLDDRTN